MKPFSVIILTFNEEHHLPRLLESIKVLNAPSYVLDSGSSDNTLSICSNYNIEVAYNKFENHPKQWDAALNTFKINTLWVICLDADQIVTPELLNKLHIFKESDYLNVNGIYFNRKNYFKGSWIKYGGYYPKYLLKMFRLNAGFSDLNENMDHRFIVSGNTVIWENGHILEENLKENKIQFWIEKHNRYSDLLAHEEFERLEQIRDQTVKAKYWGSPDERTAWFKRIWWKLPRYTRPFLYFTYRMVFQLGILDGKTGILFHFLQGFWFRIVVDIKLQEIINQARESKSGPKNS